MRSSHSFMFAAATVVASISAARAEQASVPVVPDPASLSLVQPLRAAEVGIAPGAGAPAVAVPANAAEPRRPLMSLLDQVGVGRTLDDARIDMYGHIEAGYTRNFKHPPTFINGGQLFGRVFDIVDNEVVMNQLDFNVERRVDPTNHQFDVGGRVELLYGTDAEFIHARGLGQHFREADTPDYQLDPVQLYVDVAVPVGNGLRVRAGKFLYFYSIDPNENVFYSHGFGFNSALPLSLTGISAEYPISDQLIVEGGISLGWDNALRDNNQAIDVFGRVSYDLSENTGLTLRAIIGPEQDKDNGDYRYALDAVLSHRFSDSLSLVVNPIFAYQPNERPRSVVTGTGVGLTGTTFNSVGIPNRTPHDAWWYGVSATTVLKLDRHFSVGGRSEVYRDDGGFTTGFTQWLFEVTFGVTITPFPDHPLGSNLKIRPEVRYDYSSERVFDGRLNGAQGQTGVGHPQHDQFTFGIDAIINF